MYIKQFPLLPKFQITLEEAFSLLNQSALEKADSIYKFERIGEFQGQTRDSLSSYFYELYRLIEYVDYALNNLEACNLPYYTSSELDKIKSKFLIDCPLICSNPLSLEIIRIFDRLIPQNNQPQVLKWVLEPECFSSSTYYRYLQIETRIVPIPFNLNSQELIDYLSSINITNVTLEQADLLVNTRLFELVNSNCCEFDSVDDLILIPSLIVATRIEVEYNIGNGTSASIKIGNQSQVLENKFGFINFPGLAPNTTYQIELTVSNCAETKSVLITPTTPPYFVTVATSPALIGQLQFTQLQLGTTQINNFCESRILSFQDNPLVPGIYEITTILVNGEERIQDLIVTETVNGQPSGGNLTLSCIDRDYLIFIDGRFALTCTGVSSTLENNIITII